MYSEICFPLFGRLLLMFSRSSAPSEPSSLQTIHGLGAAKVNKAEAVDQRFERQL